MSQCQTILSHIKKYGYISPMIAWDRYQITTLSQRVTDLRKQGHNILTTLTQSNHSSARYAVYTIGRKK